MNKRIQKLAEHDLELKEALAELVSAGMRDVGTLIKHGDKLARDVRKMQSSIFRGAQHVYKLWAGKEVVRNDYEVIEEMIEKHQEEIKKLAARKPVNKAGLASYRSFLDILEHAIAAAYYAVVYDALKDKENQ